MKTISTFYHNFCAKFKFLRQKFILIKSNVTSRDCERNRNQFDIVFERDYNVLNDFIPVSYVQVELNLSFTPLGQVQYVNN